MFVKIGTGIGCGLVAGGHVHRGADGAAGDIGHIHVPDKDDVVCRCGNLGCLEAVAGGSALAARLAGLGLPTRTSRDVVAQVSRANRTRYASCARPGTPSAACWRRA
jgi:predicted NBD/HSP70 family sugar kinase